MAPVPARICLTGAESTGKSELARVLGARFNIPVVPEFAREYALQVRRGLTAADIEPIARGEMRNLDAVSGSEAVAILDTDLISTIVYAEFYYGPVPVWLREEARKRLADLYIVLEPDVRFVEDAARDPAADRASHHQAFLRLLLEFGANVTRIGGSWGERERRAVEAVASILAREAGRIR